MASDRRIAPATTPSPGFGQRLRAARAQRGITLQEISQSTKIPVAMLEALENDKPSRLPGGIFSRAFVRSFASAVGLDPDDAVADFHQAFPDESATTVDRRVEEAPPGTDGRLWPLLALVVGILGVVGAGAAWYRGYGPDLGAVWQRIQGPPQATLGGGAAPPRPEASEQPATAAPQPPAPSASVPPSDAASAGLQASAAVPSPPAGTASPQGVDPAAGPAPTSPAATPPGAQTSAAPAVAAPDRPADGLVRLSIQPTGPCWVKVTADGAVRLSRLVAAGERVDFAAAARLQLEVGDAGAFAYTVDGRPGRPLGSPGRVARVTIDAASATGFVAP